MLDCNLLPILGLPMPFALQNACCDLFPEQMDGCTCDASLHLRLLLTMEVRQ